MVGHKIMIRKCNLHKKRMRKSAARGTAAYWDLRIDPTTTTTYVGDSDSPERGFGGGL